MEESQKQKIKKQMEYYLSDKNLKQDEFFHKLISENKEGYIELSHFMKCNNIVKMNIKESDIVESVKDSEELQLSKNKKQIRRKNNKQLPELIKRKRDIKAIEKKEEKKQQEEVKQEGNVIQRDDKGHIIFNKQDFQDPLIVQFETKVKENEEFKVQWKEVEKFIKENFDQLKVVYSRADLHIGQIALSQYKLNEQQLQKLLNTKMKVQERDFTFKKLEGDELKKFWEKQGSHYSYCIQAKLKISKRQQKNKKEEKKEKAKKEKVSYEIAGAYYQDINKVKSKSRAILNLKKDGEKITGNDELFLKELLEFHEKKDQKLKSFSHFIVDQNPQFEKTRCFFVVRKNGEKEDFSISKCISNLEKNQ